MHLSGFSGETEPVGYFSKLVYICIYFKELACVIAGTGKLEFAG